jgi:hypothetical protein
MIRNLAERKKNWTPHPYKIRLLDARAVVKTVAFVDAAENTPATSMVLTRLFDHDQQKAIRALFRVINVRGPTPTDAKAHFRITQTSCVHGRLNASRRIDGATVETKAMSGAPIRLIQRGYTASPGHFFQQVT